MRVTAEIALRGVARTLRERIAPALDDPFAKEAVRLAELVIGIVARGIDEAAAIRVGENARLRALFAQAGALSLPDADLAARLAEASRSIDTGLRISELDAENGRLRDLLVELHRAVEAQPDKTARGIDVAIWRFLGEAETERTPRT